MTSEDAVSPSDQFPARLSAADALMWRIERDPLLRSTVSAVSILDRAPDWDALRSRVVLAARSIPRLRQRVVDRFPALGPPAWELDPDFDVDYHLRRMALPSPAGLAAVLEIAAANAMTAFDPCRPLWRFDVVEGLEGGQAALIQKLHHSVADGIAGLRLAAGLLDLQREPTSPPPLAEAAAADLEVLDGTSPAASSLARRASTAIARAAGTMSALPIAALRTGSGFARSPISSAGRVADSVRWGARLLAPARSPMSPLMRGRGTMLRFDAFDVELQGLRAAAHAGGCKLNDAYLAAVVGGLGTYHERRGGAVDALRMTLPVSIRIASDPLGSNRFTLLRLVIPVLADPLERMKRIRDLTTEWRSGPALGLTDFLARGLSRLPTPLATTFFGQMLKSVDFVATNVRGFPAPLYLAGAEILRLYAFAPPSGAALNVALVSHVDKCCIGVNSDTRAVPDADLLISCLVEGFDEVLRTDPPGRAERRGKGPVKP